MKNSNPKTKGAWIHRFSIRFFSVLLAILIYWLLGFVVDDIGSLPGPKYDGIEKQYLDQSLVKKKEELEKRIGEITRTIDEQKVKQGIIGNSTRSLQKTMDQLLDLQKLSLQKDLTFSEPEQKAFTESLNLFLSNQKRYQGINEDIAGSVEEKAALQSEKRGIEKRLEDQRKPAREAYRALARTHDNWLAFYKLLVLIPIFIGAVYLFIKKRTSVYFPLILAIGAADFLKISFVLHEHFPSRYFKYALMAVAIAAVIKLLVYFIRSIASPGKQWLLKQYREAYERFLCPVCEYPIRRGPMKYLFWNRRTIAKLRPPQLSGADESRYACPACGTSLFGKCSSCNAIRHSLLPFCEQCGTEIKKEERT